MFNGLGMGLGNLSRLSAAQTRSISPENFSGKAGCGGMAETGNASAAARDLGRGWKVNPYIILEPGETHTLAEIDGPGALQSMWMTGIHDRYLILRIYWDGQSYPSVETPACDFFAYGWAKNVSGLDNGFPTLTSVPVMVAPNRGLSCFWEMPFRKKCLVTLENISEDKKTCYYQINYTLTDVPEDAAYFHARFNRTNPIGYKDVYTVIDGIEGKGHYVGTALSVGLNGSNSWWGEGEIKFYIDGDGEYPTICGTGTEDYFLGAYNWDVNGKYTTYSGPWAGMHQVIQPDGLYVSQQRFSMYRWHIMDPIRFEKGLRVTLQDLGWRDKGRYLARQDDFASVAFWYQELPGKQFPPLPCKDDLEIT